jgi:hypothetical protein
MEDYPFETSGLSVRAKGVLQQIYDKPEVYFFEPVTSEDDVRKLLESGEITKVRDCGRKTYQELCHHFGTHK